MRRRDLKYIVLSGLLVLTLAGCNEYRVETDVREDGSGTRKMTFSMDRDQNEVTDLGPEEYASMFGIGPDDNWKMQVVADAAEVDGKEGKIKFAMKSVVDGVEEWSKLDGSISVRGTLEESEYSGVFFTNVVSLETGRAPSGRSYTYRESFRWNGLIETVVDFQADAYARKMQEDFPHLDEEAIAELRGLMAGHLLVGVRYLDIWGDNDRERQEVALSIGRAAEEIVRKAGRKVHIERIYEVARIYVDDEDKTLEAFIEKNLPGVMYAGLTDVKMRIRMPGKVVETNGTIKDDGSVEWKMDLLEALGGEVVFHVRSELSGS